MNRDDIKAKIIEEIYMIAPDLEGEEIAEDENLQASLGIDSYDFLHLLTALNEKLSVEVPESDYGRVDTLNRMTDYFAGRM